MRCGRATRRHHGVRALPPWRNWQSSRVSPPKASMTSSLQIAHGGLYSADLNPRLGTEPGKVRPVLVIQTNLLNEVGHPSTWVLPCTTRLAGENLLRVPLPRGAAGNRESCEIMVDQSRAVDNRRLKRLLGMLPLPLLLEVKEKLRSLAEL